MATRTRGDEGEPLVTSAGLWLAWNKMWPVMVLVPGFIVMLSRPLGIWTIPLATVSSGTLVWVGGRVHDEGLTQLGRYVLGFFAFTALRHLADDIGPKAFIDYPIAIDRFLAFGVLPNQWAQATFPGLAQPAVLVYTSYFYLPPLALVLIWRWWRERLRPYVSATLALFVTSAIVHIAIPTAPPWVAARLGVIDGVRSVVFDYLEVVLPTAYQFGTGVSANMVAAMPSVHLGVTMLVLLALWTTPLRLPAAGYLAAMALTVVYTGDHYVIDVIAGIALASACWKWATR